MNGRTSIRPGSDERREVLEGILIALLINGIFLGVIALWPVLGRTLFGWFFALFGWS